MGRAQEVVRHGCGRIVPASGLCIPCMDRDRAIVAEHTHDRPRARDLSGDDYPKEVVSDLASKHLRLLQRFETMRSDMERLELRLREEFQRRVDSLAVSDAPKEQPYQGLYAAGLVQTSLAAGMRANIQIPVMLQLVPIELVLFVRGTYPIAASLNNFQIGTRSYVVGNHGIPIRVSSEGHRWRFDDNMPTIMPSIGARVNVANHGAGAILVEGALYGKRRDDENEIPF